MKTRLLWTREEESFRNIRWRGKCWTLAAAGGLLKLFLVLLYVYVYRQLISMWHQVHVYNGPVHWQIGDDCYSLVIRCSSTDNDTKMRFKTSNHPFADAVLGIQAFSTICALQLIVYQGTSKYQMMVVVDLRTRDAVPFLANAILTERPLNATTASVNPADSTIASWTQKKRLTRQIYWWSRFLSVQQ